jgi:hypothetical protein
MEAFECFTDNFEIIHEDVFVRTFSQYLHGNARLWFRNLKADSIGSWAYFHDLFLRYWGENKSYEQYLSEFSAMKRRRDETVVIFNRIFQNFYLSMPIDIRPSEVVARVFYTATHHHPYLTLFLRERRSLTLQQMFTDAEEIEDNLRACGNLSDQIWDEDVDAQNWMKSMNNIDQIWTFICFSALMHHFQIHVFL